VTSSLRLWVESRIWSVRRALRRWSHRGPMTSGRSRRTVRRLRRAEERLQDLKAADPTHLQWFEATTHSQNGEDGLIAEIFRRIGTSSRTFVEIGAADGVQNCTAALVDAGWRGTWVEGDAQRAEAARANAKGTGVTVCHAFVDRDNIVSLLDESQTPREVDLLVLDIDGNDYWVLERLGRWLHPRAMVLEYNATVGPWLGWAMPYDARHLWDETSWHGASLAALTRLGRGLGFTLVGCDSRGVNAFFVRTSLAGAFGAGSVRRHWVPPRYQLPYGHPDSRPLRFDASPIPESDAASVVLTVDVPQPHAVQAGALIYFTASVRNGSRVAIGESTTNPVRLAAWWTTNGTKRTDDEQRSIQPWRVEPGSTGHLVGQVQAPPVDGSFALEVGLVQEGIRWMPETVHRCGTWQVSTPR
jgi:hypothetical protein